MKYKSCAANAEFQKNADADKTAANYNNLLQFSILRGGGVSNFIIIGFITNPIYKYFVFWRKEKIEIF